MGVPPRNDVEAAAKVAERAMRRGDYSPELAQVLLQLQDDPTELIEAVDALAEKYGVKL